MSVWSKLFNLFQWENSPSTKTPLGATLLQRINVALAGVDDRVIELDTRKMDVSTSMKMVQSWVMDVRTGVITVKLKDGTTTTYDTALEKVPISGIVDTNTNKLVFTNSDGSKTEVDLSKLVTQYEFADTNTVGFTIAADGKVSCIVKDGSITESKLQTHYLANIKVEVAKAEGAARQATDMYNSSSEQAVKSKSYAVGGTATRAGEDTDNAKYYSQKAGQSEQNTSSYTSTALGYKNESGLYAKSAEQSKNAAHASEISAETASIDATKTAEKIRKELENGEINGSQGIQGPQGEIGPIGPQGSTGAVGATGPQGAKGDTGAKGSQGIQGAAGAQGSTGATGAQGSTGATGATGAQGVQGIQGTPGVRGSQWYKGTGITGTSATATAFPSSGVTSALVGDHYINTSTGNAYYCTVAGATSVAKWIYECCIKGATGPQGIQGATGAQGSTGATGAQGSTGATGAQGSTGATGATGAQGVQGIQGTPGVRGSQWYKGTGITGTSATATAFPSSGVTSALVGDHYINTSTGNAYYCTVAGATSVAKWIYECCIKGATGPQGIQGATYTHPATHPASMIAEDANNRFVTDNQIAIWNNKADIATFSATINTTWSGTTAPYTQVIPVTGIVAADNPMVDVVLSATITTALAQEKAWNYVSRIVTGENKVTVYCNKKKPTTAIPIQLKVVR